ncbi:MAG: glycoside hydrolase family 2 TIM barrel-domain containing protein [Lachnospiraceae bacterium]|nr:glycoside hydrolase family 2 TIM barrel-domain containing protein [Lachnospiraceae bacterium]
MGIYHKLAERKKEYCDLLTEAAEQRRQENGWKQYPRPQMKRELYQILHENWKLNGQNIRVPFPPQSVLSEYQGQISECMTYEMNFRIPASFIKERILLHFGAVDQIAEVWINDVCMGRHEGGYLMYTLDISDVVKREENNKMVVKVTDKLSKIYPYGKQRKKRGGMWYTPISGIWQSIWLENVPADYIENIRMKPDLDGIHIQIQSFNTTLTEAAGANDIRFTATITLDNGEVLTKNFDNPEGYICLSDYVCADGSRYRPQYWTPENPYLYSMKIKAGNDTVETYFALRTIEIKEVDGCKRVCLNGKPIFLHGVLDQGYYSDGIFLPAEPEEYERDILRMKELGFNLLRKHIKVEPECFYYYCDKYGMLVMQDMVNNGGYSFLRDTALPTFGMKRKKDTGGKPDRRKAFFREHTKQTIQQLYNHPCIIAYTIFNEGWGQFDSDAMYDWLRTLDDSRLIDSTSGWFKQKKNDFDSEHIYFRIRDLKVGSRPLFVTECGGYTRMIEGHSYNPKHSYGYGSAADQEELTDMINTMYRQMILPGMKAGVCGCIYTQLSDVEDEVNGLYTYDRKVCKVDKDVMIRLADELKL